MSLYNPKLNKLLLCVFLLCSFHSHAQQERLDAIEKKLAELSTTVSGLNEKTEISIAGSSVQEFLRALAQMHRLNISVDPLLNQKIVNNFSGEKVSNILLYMAKTYNLDIDIIGAILIIKPYQPPLIPPKPKEIKSQYDPSNHLITLDLTEDTLYGVAKKITQLSNKNIIVLPNIRNKIINGYFQSLTVESALEKIAVTNQLKISRTNDSSYVIEQLGSGEELTTKRPPISNNNFTIKSTSQNGLQSSAVNVEKETSKKIVSLNVVNTPIRDIIKNISEQAGFNYFIYSDITGNITANAHQMNYEQALNMLLMGTHYTYSVNNGIYMIGERNYEGLRGHKLIQLQYRSVDSLIHMIPEQFKQNVTIKEFKELNSFLVNGSEPQINEIETFVKQIDKKVPMVTIEVILMDLKKGHSVSTGIKAGVSDSIQTGGTILGGLNYTFGAADINRFIERIGLNNVFNIGRVSPNFYVQLSALESNNNIELRQTPKLSTLNGHVANLSIGSTRYYSVETQNVIGSLNPSTVVTQQFYPVEANLSIDIVPFVSGDDNVTLTIGVNISDFTEATKIDEPPPTSTSKFKSIIRVKNEEMILLGGIERTEKSETGSGVPILSRIPVLKWLFSSKTRSNSKVVSIVFIKPTIIY